jgi:hypothetical protein
MTYRVVDDSLIPLLCFGAMKSVPQNSSLHATAGPCSPVVEVLDGAAGRAALPEWAA